MSSTSDSSFGHGTNGSPQGHIEERNYPLQEALNEKNIINNPKPPRYVPSPKHEQPHNYGSPNPIKTKEEGQRLLKDGKISRSDYNRLRKGKNR